VTFDKTANTLTVAGNLISNSTSLTISNAVGSMTLNPGTIIAASGNSVGIYANNASSGSLLLYANGYVTVDSASTQVALSSGSKSLVVSSAGASGFSGSNTFNIGTNSATISPGYSWLPNGLLMQWGTASASSSAPATVTFAFAFPTAMHGVTATQNGGTYTASTYPLFTAVSRTGFTLASGATTAKTFFWQAIGY
jgi:hypothetical protein